MKSVPKISTKTPAKVAPLPRLKKTSGDRLSASDFLLGPNEFVRRCASVFLTEHNALSTREIQQLVDAIQSGCPRLEVVDVISAKANPIDPQLLRQRHNPAAMSSAPFIITRLLERFSPDDNEVFVVEVYEQAAGRAPSGIELAAGCFDLKRGLLTRRQYIEKIAERSAVGRLSPEPENTVNLTTDGAAGAIISKNGSQHISLVRDLGTLGWLVAPNSLLQPIVPKDGAMTVPEGWLLAGPKKSLSHGHWSLDVDIVQPPRARLVIDVIANSGLDRLVNVEITGSCFGAFCFQVTPQHHFLEARIFKPQQEDALHVLTIRNFSISSQV
jgi:hypothetical protein